MKTLPRIMFLPLTLSLLLSQCKKDPELVHIPDAAFRIALINERVDTDGDGQISCAEAEAIRALDVYLMGISNMTGIEAFINLETLVCSSNRLTTLDISKNAALTLLDCPYNQLTSLDVSKNTALESLGCVGNQITNLDFSTNNALKILICGENQLAGLNISNNTALTRLWCDDNQLTTLDVSNNPSLNQLFCGSNQLKSLDISNNNAIGTVDQGYGMADLGLDNMPSLGEVCVWESFPADVVYSILGSPNVYFTTDCIK